MIDTTSKFGFNTKKRKHGQVNFENSFEESKRMGQKRANTGLVDMTALSLSDRVKVRQCPAKIQFLSQEIHDNILGYLSCNSQISIVNQICKRFYEDVVPTNF